MNESGKWTEVNYSEVGDVTVERNSSNQNIKLSLMVSPMDVPVAWRHLEESGKVTLEFQYLSATEAFISKTIENISFVLGKNSRRIYKIIVDINGFVKMGMPKGELLIELKEATTATSTLKNNGVVKKPNAKAIMNMLKHEAAVLQTAAG